MSAGPMTLYHIQFPPNAWNKTAAVSCSKVNYPPPNHLWGNPHDPELLCSNCSPICTLQSAKIRRQSIYSKVLVRRNLGITTSLRPEFWKRKTSKIAPVLFRSTIYYFLLSKMRLSSTFYPHMWGITTHSSYCQQVLFMKMMKNKKCS